MTREAIEYFKFHRKIFCEDHLKICPKDSIAYQATLKEKEFYDMAIKALEQEPQTFKWCTDCKEYDQEKHCCHRWSKVIRDTVEEMKQEYIERDVLDKIRAEIQELPITDTAVKLVTAVIDKYKKDCIDR